jgi:hypothetical protein
MENSGHLEKGIGLCTDEELAKFNRTHLAGTPRSSITCSSNA